MKKVEREVKKELNGRSPLRREGLYWTVVACEMKEKKKRRKKKNNNNKEEEEKEEKEK